MSNKKIAEKLGIAHDTIALSKNPSEETWMDITSGASSSVEEAALSYFRTLGWNGYAGEGGLILNVIKAASFDTLPFRNKTTYIEALYAQNVAFDEDRYQINDLINTIRSSSLEQIKKNVEMMFNSETRTERLEAGGVSITTTSSGNIKDYFPDLDPNIMVDFYNSIGRERLAQIAELFAKDPYEYRKGWPDLTLWRHSSDEIIFREVKAPSDRIRPSQKRLITDVLIPLGYDVGIVDVEKRQAASTS
jgi:hypothetical protein